ncbi:MAG: dihydrolipoyllysine-residue acetyltransferase [candidate division KSB1 bacterium]|nr:dihydrolipoyllysine-residue acetyltransferase [candidate division KSB1 bacterium]
MSMEIKLPELGENIDSGSVASVLIKKGDTVEKDQPLIELETEKAVVEVPSDAAGVVQDVLVNEGDEVKTGQVIVKLEEGQASTSKPAEKESSQDTEKEEPGEESKKRKKETQKEPEPEEPAADEPPAGETQTVDLQLPALGENVTNGTIAGILIKEGDTISEGQNLFEIETEKAVAEMPSEVSGTVQEILVSEGQELQVGDTVARIITGTQAPASQKKKTFSQQESKEEKKEAKTEAETEPKKQKSFRPASSYPLTDSPAPAAPSVRRFAREIGVDINQVKGTSAGGRISMDDVKAHSKQQHEQKSAQPSPTAVQVPMPDFSKWGEIERKRMSKIRETTARRLSQAWNAVPHVTQFDKADVTKLEKLRKQQAPKAEKAGGKLTITAILLKIVASALQKFPQFNAAIDMENKEIIYKKYFSIGIAVDTEHGLVVPVVRDVDKKNIIDLSVELSEIAVKARERKLSLEDMQGGNFSISNLGGLGGTAFTPVVNAPEPAILGVSRGGYEPRYEDGEWVPKMMMPLSLSYDHRLIDGADGVRFLRWICEALEEPFTVLLEG